VTGEGAPQGDRIRVCHIITLLELGGAQQNTLHTVAHLDRSRFQAILVTGSGGILDEEARRIPGLRTIFVADLVRETDPLRDLSALLRLTTLLRRERPDIVHTHSSKAGILGRWAAFLAGVPIIIHTIHGFGITPELGRARRWLFHGLESGAATVTTRFLAVSRADLEKGVASRLFPRERALLLRSGVNLSAFRNGASPGNLRAAFGIPPAAPLAGMVACLKPQKAPLDFVSVAERVARRVPSAHFLLVGDGVLRGRVESAVSRAGLEGRFHLLGWRRDIPSIMKNLSVLVLTSLWEGLPRVVPEAMAAGLPVVATRVDGTPEVVVDGENGFLAEPGDIEALADRVAQLLSDPALAGWMGAAGRLIGEEFDIDGMVRRQEALYQELMTQGH
jgi:glycosyltransferase involved in cell wall biosynthesis